MVNFRFSCVSVPLLLTLKLDFYSRRVSEVVVAAMVETMEETMVETMVETTEEVMEAALVLISVLLHRTLMCFYEMMCFLWSHREICEKC